jgi:hypothetical protein
LRRRWVAPSAASAPAYAAASYSSPQPNQQQHDSPYTPLSRSPRGGPLLDDQDDIIGEDDDDDEDMDDPHRVLFRGPPTPRRRQQVDDDQLMNPASPIISRTPQHAMVAEMGVQQMPDGALAFKEVDVFHLCMRYPCLTIVGRINRIRQLQNLYTGVYYVPGFVAESDKYLGGWITEEAAVHALARWAEPARYAAIIHEIKRGDVPEVCRLHDLIRRRRRSSSSSSRALYHYLTVVVLGGHYYWESLLLLLA